MNLYFHVHELIIQPAIARPGQILGYWQTAGEAGDEPRVFVYRSDSEIDRVVIPFGRPRDIVSQLEGLVASRALSPCDFCREDWDRHRKALLAGHEHSAGLQRRRRQAEV